MLWAFARNKEAKDENGYVAEFTLFMNHCLAEHPQVVEDP